MTVRTGVMRKGSSDLHIWYRVLHYTHTQENVHRKVGARQAGASGFWRLTSTPLSRPCSSSRMSSEYRLPGFIDMIPPHLWTGMFEFEGPAIPGPCRYPTGCGRDTESRRYGVKRGRQAPHRCNVHRLRLPLEHHGDIGSDCTAFRPRFTRRKPPRTTGDACRTPWATGVP